MPVRCQTMSGMILLGAILGATASPAQIIHVDHQAPGPEHDGSSWCAAFVQLHEALDVAVSGSMIRVADGIYLPDTTGLPDPREATFTIPAGVTIAGGYAGCGAPDPDARDPYLYMTELSGDLNGDDPAGGSDGGFYDENAYHVITAAAMASVSTLSGLVIRSGHAGASGQGAGILAPGGRLVLSGCTMTDNRAWRGGAIYIEIGELHLFQCRFTGNRTTGEGGAIFDAMASLEAHNSLFVRNEAGNDGGAIFLDLCSADFLNCSFGGNATTARGGALYLYVGVEAYAGNCIFWGNSDQAGGEGSGIFVNPSNIISIDYSCIQGGAGGSGGEGNIDDDPLLVDVTTGDLHLLPGSPCIDHGSNALVSAQLDLDGNPRILNDTVDMGCYEFQTATGVPESGHQCGRPRILRIGGPLDPLGPSGDPDLTVRFLPPAAGRWSLVIYDLRGRLLKQLGHGHGGSGPLELGWDGRDAAGRLASSGVYLFALQRSNQLLDSRKAIHLR